MERIIKLFGVLALCLTLSVVSTSCGNNEPEETSDNIHDPNLIGTWVYLYSDGDFERYTFRADGTGRMDMVELGDYYRSEFSWTSDGFLLTTVITYDSDPDEIGYSESIPYMIIGNRLYLNGSDEPYIKQK